MPRQQIVYLVPEPLEPLNLEEVKFWLRIMQEHALFIKSGLPCDQTEYIDEAQAFYQEFESLRLRADRLQSDRRFTELVNDTQVLVREFYTFKRNLLHMTLECRLGGCNFALFLDHVAREAEYFIRLLDKIRNNKVLTNGGTKAQEETFWLRIMADHAKFISHRLDPSERNLIATANAFSDEFDNLFMQGNDFSSMLHGYSEVASFKRFIQDARAATVRLRDFKRAAEEMIVECRLVGIIPAQLADHVRREADHFLMIMAMMEKGITKNMPMITLDAIEDNQDDECVEDIAVVPEVHEKCKIYKVMKPIREEEKPPANEQIQIQPIINDKKSSKSKVSIEPKNSPEPKNKGIPEKIAVEEEVVIDKPASTLEPPTSESKYKWSGKWPRQLGKKRE
ncbi:MAG: DUF2935 domain-containing protein [Sporomusaceae bacterium]|nr:DUF2935 domain-containing protein [Sporomusaceae bacterium]